LTPLLARRLAAGAALAALVLGPACTGTAPRPESPPEPRQGPLAPTSGTLAVPGLAATVRVVRDRWGIPHIYASTQEDLFLAQGFVQAQDRLFQIDLWRRSTQGRLAEILGPDFIARDRMTRLLAYRGDMEVEWASYAPDARGIAEQFVRGVNAWVDIARRDPPEEFRVAGYLPERWEPADLLSRAEAFVMSQNALAEVFNARMITAVGADEARRLLRPDPPVALRAPNGVDLAIINDQLAEGLRRIASPPVFGPPAPGVRAGKGFAGPAAEIGSNNWVVSGARSATRRPLLANDPHRALDHPSLRYLVHLKAPGWNVIGAVVPWFPGVAIGHNERIAWGLTIFANDVQDLFVERMNPANPRQYEWQGRWLDVEVRTDSILVKGRAAPVAVEHVYTRHGPIVGVDRERHVSVALRWTGAEPGTAGYLGALSLDRAATWPEFRRALERWKMPGENFVYADVDGNIGYQAAAMAPIRRNGTGLLPSPGWTGEYEWSGWYSLDDLPHEANPASGYLATANNNMLPPGFRPRVGHRWSDPARINRVRAALGVPGSFSVERFQALQHDARSWKADQLVPLLEPLTLDGPRGRARRLLLDWNRTIVRGSPAAALYVIWERQLAHHLVGDRLDRHLKPEFLARESAFIVPALVRPSREWFGDGAPARARDRLLAAALGAAIADAESALGTDWTSWDWGRLHTATFRHALATTDSLASRFNVGPIVRDGYATTVLATGGAQFTQTSGASFREILDVADWDRSVATSAAGQSGQPGSPHFDDLARLWGRGEYFPLSFTDEAVARHGEAILTLTPGR
jgi:penicillin amidase